MNREKFIEILNNFAFENEIVPVINCLNELFDNGKYTEMLDLVYISIANTQLYGFLSYLNDEERNVFFESDYFRSNSYRGIDIPFYNRGQLSFLYELDYYQKIFFSAPTSFGKTSIVTEYILNNYQKLNNIIFIVPTNSLLEELFGKYTSFNSKLQLKYNVTTQPTVVPGERNILFLTPERFMVIAQEKVLSKFDIIVMDETYKIVDARNQYISDFVNNRAVRFRKVADLIAKSKSKVIFLSPFTYTLTDSMQRFLEKYSIKKIDRKLEYVKREVVRVENSIEVNEYFGKRIKYQKGLSQSDKAKLINLHLSPSNSIIYVPNYSKAYQIAKDIDYSCLKKSNDIRYLAFLKHIEDNFLVAGRENWVVYEALKKGIGIYISPIPRYIKKEIIKLYEENVISTLIVTSAFTEGVNTCASNLIFTSLINGPNTNKLTDIDVLNVSGRVGRFAKNTTGRIFCISSEVYNKVKELQTASDIKLENYNYMKNHSRINFEIEMIDEEFLSNNEKEMLRQQKEEMMSFGLSKSDLNISLNVSNEWKLLLYKYFSELNYSELSIINETISSIYSHEEGNRINSLDFIFKDLKIAFDSGKVEGFPQEPYDVKPFDRSGEFVWGRLYQVYVSGTPKRVIENNIKFITKKYAEVVKNQNPKSKESIDHLFEAEGKRWILKYYTKNLQINMNAFYAETFKFVSNIVQYKLPFYLTFYVSIFKLYVIKNNLRFEDDAEFDIKKLINIFEDGDTPDEYSRLVDYGLPLTTITKMQTNHIRVEALKKQTYDKKLFDAYEIIVINEISELL